MIEDTNGSAMNTETHIEDAYSPTGHIEALIIDTEKKLTNSIVTLFDIHRQIDNTKPIPRNADKIAKLKVMLSKQQAQVSHLKYLVAHPELINPFS